MRYKVYDVTNPSDAKNITDNPTLILKPNGRLAMNDYGDETGLSNCVAIFFPTDKDDYYIDEVGGVHECGLGYAPDGKYCGECSHLTCKTCGIWNGM